MLLTDMNDGEDGQVRMFFSSGAAHTNGGGSFCIATYSFVNCALDFVRDIFWLDVWDCAYSFMCSFAGHSIEACMSKMKG